MTLTIPLSPDEEANLQAHAKEEGLPMDSCVRTALLPILSGQRAAHKTPTKSCLGALAHLGSAPSAEEIDRNRAEMFSSFGRDDIA
jgi:hypothetical protein